MVRTRERARTVPSFVGDFLRALPEHAATVVESYGEMIPAVDVSATLAQCTDAELLAALSMQSPRTVTEMLGRIGVTSRGARPRQTSVMRTKLSHGLRTADQSSTWLTHMMAEATYKLLVSRATGLADRIPDGVVNPAVDTPTLRALALAIALRMPDPSAPLILAGMLDSDDPAVELLFTDEQVQTLRDGAAQLRDSWDHQWEQQVQHWAWHRSALDAITATRQPHGAQHDIDNPDSDTPATEQAVQEPGNGHRPRHTPARRTDEHTLAAAAVQAAAPAPPSATGQAATPPAAPPDTPSTTPPAERSSANARTAPDRAGSTAPGAADRAGQLTETHAAAAHAAARIHQDLQAQRPAAPADLATVQVWSQVLASLSSELQLAADSDLSAVSRAAAAAGIAGQVRQTLTALGAASGPDALTDTLDALRTHVDDVLAAGDDALADDPRTAALQDLHALVTAAQSGAADDDDLFERGAALKKALPEPLSRLGAAAAMGRIVMPAAAAAQSATSTPRAQLTTTGAERPASTEPPAAPQPPPTVSRDTPTAAATTPTPAVAQPAAVGPAAEPTAAAAPAGDEPAGTPKPNAGRSTRDAEPPQAQPPAAQSAALAAPVTPTAQPVVSTPATAAPTTASITPPAAPPAPLTATPPAERPTAPASTPTQRSAGTSTPQPATATLEATRLGITTPTTAALAPQIIDVVDRLLIDARLGLAHEILQAAGSVAHADSVEIAALADALQGPGGPCEVYLEDLLDAVDVNDLKADGACTLLSTAALLTATVLTGSTRAAQLLPELVDQLDACWAKLAKLAADAAASGALTDRTARAQVGTDDLARVAADAATLRAEKAFTLRTPRSTQLLTELRGPDSVVGQALAIAASNDTAKAEQVARELAALRSEQVTQLVRSADRTNRSSGKSLAERDQRDVVDALLADRTAALRWAEAASTSAGADWTAERLMELRTHLLDQSDTLTAALTGYTDDMLGSGAAAVAGRALQKVRDVVTGQYAPSVERSPHTVLHLESLKIEGTQYDVSSGKVLLDQDRYTTDEQVRALLVAAAEPDFDATVQRRIAEDDFVTALRCAEELGAAHVEQVRQARARRIEQLGEELRRQRLLLVRVRSGAAGVKEQDMLEAQLVQAELLLTSDSQDVSAAAAALTDVRQAMADLRTQAVNKLCAKITEVYELGELSEGERERLLSKLRNDEFDQVEYELLYLERGEPVPDEDDSELAAFYPAAVQMFAGGLTTAHIDQLIAGQTVGPVTLPADDELRAQIGQALRCWTKLPEALRSGAPHETVRDLLAPALRRLGLEFGPYAIGALQIDTARGRGRRLLSLEARPTGRAMIPAFGSLAGGRYRLLLVWEKPTVEQLSDWRELDSTGGDPLIICYFGTLSAQDRERLSREWNEPTLRPAVIVDDAVLAYTAAARRNAFSILMHVTMPFSATAPFSTEKTAKVPMEMFYGRQAVMREIVRPDGPSMIFGGRGMGKSALLSVIQRRARSNLSENLTVVWIELERSPEFDEPMIIWSKLAEALADEGVVSATRGASSMRPDNRVERLITEWLDANPGSKLLLLIDEADAFFSADARREFRQTSKLFKLANSTNRCKVVFAGLHGVAHHHGVGNNPFSPSGALPIGPLERGDAYRLLTRPLRTLGYEMGMDEANLVLMHCNNQPYLIQLVAARLTGRLLRARAKVDELVLPRPVPRAAIEAVLKDSTLREQIHRAFKITLDLDPRFSVIVHLLAQYAYGHGQVPLPEADLLEQCRVAWSNGFADTSFASFRELLNELEALGMLGAAEPSRGGRTLRSTAVLQSLGTREHIQLSLDEIRATALPEADARLHFRPSIGEEGRPGPLTSAQLADLAGRPGNRVRIVVGSELSGLGEVVTSLQDPVYKPVLRDVRVTTGKGEFRDLLKTGLKSEKRLTVVSPLHELVDTTASCEAALQTAEQLLPTDPDHFRAVVLTTGPANADWLWQVASRPDIDSLVVPLERMRRSTIRLHWRDASRKLRPLGDELADRVMQLTGGWPGLIDRVTLRARKYGAEQALDELAAEQSERSWAGSLLTQAGVLRDADDRTGVVDGMLLRVVRLLADLGDGCPAADLREFAADDGIDEASLTVATWFALLDHDDADQVTLDPLVRDAWRAWSI